MLRNVCHQSPHVAVSQFLAPFFQFQNSTHQLLCNNSCGLMDSVFEMKCLCRNISNRRTFSLYPSCMSAHHDPGWVHFPFTQDDVGFSTCQNCHTNSEIVGGTLSSSTRGSMHTSVLTLLETTFWFQCHKNGCTWAQVSFHTTLGTSGMP